jgi:phage-related minor tail protein
MTNTVNIDITSTDKANLSAFAKGAKQAGKEIADGIGQGIDAAERKVRESGEKIAKPMKESATKIDKSFDMAARQVGRYMYQIERQAWASGEGMDGAFSAASRKIRADLDQVRKDAAKTGDGLESDLGGALKKINEQASHLGESIQKSGGGKGGGLIDSLIGDLGSAKGALAAGAAIGGFLLKGIQSEWAEDKVGGLLAAQTGAAASAAEGLGNTAGDIFADNFGDSVDQVGEAMASVFENKLIDTTASQASIAAVTEKVITLSQVTGESFDKIAYAASRAVKSGIAGSVSEAMDLIGKAQENGLNAADDLLDTLTEYGTKFRDLGLTGQESLGLIQQAMEGGARNTDIAADALKEFAIRAQDMSVLTRAGFETIGMDADVMGQRIAKGGQSAHDALRDTLNALNAMPPGVARNTAAVDLFGTKAEDLGNALYNMDLDEAADKFGDFGGTVEEQMKKIGDAASFWDKLGKGISGAAGKVGEFLDKVSDIDLPDELAGTLNEISEAQKQFDLSGNTKALDELKAKYPEAADAIDGYIKKKNDEKAANDAASGSIEEYVGTLDTLISKQHEAATGQIDLSEAQIKSNQAIGEARTVMEEFAGKGLTATKTGFDITTEAGQKLQGSLNDIVASTFETIEAMRQQSASSEEIRAYLVQQRQAFYDLAVGMGISTEAAQALTDKLFGFPDEVAPVVGIKDKASGPIQKLINAIAAIPAYKRVDIYEYTHATRNASASASAPSSYSAGSRGGLAHGGIVSTAQSGGARNGSTLIDEAGGELVELPDGSRVMTAGTTRAMGEAGLLGGGGPTNINLVVSTAGAPFDEVVAEMIRMYVKPRGGNVQEVLGVR